MDQRAHKWAIVACFALTDRFRAHRFKPVGPAVGGAAETEDPGLVALLVVDRSARVQVIKPSS